MSARPAPEITRRRLLAWSGALAAAGALAACGNNTGRPETGSASGGAGGGAKPSLSQWYHQYGEVGTQQAVERYAADYPDADIKVTWKPGDYDNTVVATLQTDGAPDIFEYGNGPTIDMITSGQVSDVTDLFGDAKSDFNEALLKRVTYQDKIWAVPQVMDMQLLIYRPSLLEAAGMKPPKSMDELMVAAAALTTGKVKGLFLGNDGGAGLMGGPMLRSAGLDLLTDDGKVGFDDPKAAQALSLLRKMYTDKVVLLGAPNDWFAPDALTQGLAAMQFTGLWNLPAITAALGNDIGVLPWPAMPGGNPNVTLGAYGACINSKGADVEAAKAFVKSLWIENTESQTDWATSYGLHIPARTSVAEKADKLASGPAAEAVRLSKENGYVQNHILWSPKSQSSFNDAMSRIVKNGADPKAELDTVKGVVEAELKRFSS
ncbi:ABC transporter substrate-binding protein [Gephyromycinifex aptenodytis]|uniref:ABC transporter substrate-binding protein n=1 Tax=Gephyromycinifex aptenodytis TaxID=2716227 RepID=UPI0014465777|nr:sugar ABC transporter substrate-binding protein [Gephyromycinifex aptenodytis]